MSLTSNNLLAWSDIETIFSNLNTARKKFGFTTVSTPSNKNTLAKSEVASSVERYIEDMQNNQYVRTVAVVNDAVPRVSELINPLIFTRMSTVISNVNNTCAFDASFKGSNNAHTQFSSNFSHSQRSSNNGHTNFSSNNGHTNNSSNHGHTNNTSWCTSFRTSDNGFTQNTFRFVGA